jgi:mannose-6-phosphate isomerase-like protein (cupin superfamily)
MDRFTLPKLLAAQQAGNSLYHEFLRVPALSGGLYVLDAGSSDPQAPHGEDEVYVVMEGRGQIAVGGEVQPVGPGTVVYVATGVDHRFLHIEQRLVVLVFFAPAEG